MREATGMEPQHLATMSVSVGPAPNALSDRGADRASGCRFRHTRLSICGRPAERVTLECPEQEILCAEFTDGFSHPIHTPPMTKWVLAFDTGRMPGSVSIAAPTAFGRALSPVVERVLVTSRLATDASFHEQCTFARMFEFLRLPSANCALTAEASGHYRDPNPQTGPFSITRARFFGSRHSSANAGRVRARSAHRTRDSRPRCSPRSGP